METIKIGYSHINALIPRRHAFILPASVVLIYISSDFLTLPSNPMVLYLNYVVLFLFGIAVYHEYLQIKDIKKFEGGLEIDDKQLSFSAHKQDYEVSKPFVTALADIHELRLDKKHKTLHLLIREEAQQNHPSAWKTQGFYFSHYTIGHLDKPIHEVKALIEQRIEQAKER